MEGPPHYRPEPCPLPCDLAAFPVKVSMGPSCGSELALGLGLVRAVWGSHSGPACRRAGLRGSRPDFPDQPPLAEEQGLAQP